MKSHYEHISMLTIYINLRNVSNLDVDFLYIFYYGKHLQKSNITGISNITRDVGSFTLLFMYKYKEACILTQI